MSTGRVNNGHTSTLAANQERKSWGVSLCTSTVMHALVSEAAGTLGHKEHSVLCTWWLQQLGDTGGSFCSDQFYSWKMPFPLKEQGVILSPATSKPWPGGGGVRELSQGDQSKSACFVFVPVLSEHVTHSWPFNILTDEKTWHLAINQVRSQHKSTAPWASMALSWNACPNKVSLVWMSSASLERVR